MGASTGLRYLNEIRHTFTTTGLGQRTTVCSPVVLIKIHRQEVTGAVR